MRNCVFLIAKSTAQQSHGTSLFHSHSESIRNQNQHNKCIMIPNEHESASFQAQHTHTHTQFKCESKTHRASRRAKKRRRKKYGIKTSIEGYRLVCGESAAFELISKPIPYQTQIFPSLDSLTYEPFTVSTATLSPISVWLS